MPQLLKQEGVLPKLRANGEIDATAVLQALKVVRTRVTLATVDRDRLVRLGLQAGLSQTALATQLGVSQARISQIAASANAEQADGFSGTTPIEIAQRYAAGEIDEEQAVDELGRWPYKSSSRPDPYDDSWEPGPGTWADVELANQQGLISDEMYEAIFDRSLAAADTTS